MGRMLLTRRDELGKPLGAQALARYLIVLRRFLNDLMRRPHAVFGRPARKTRLDFMPADVLTIPDHIKRALDAVDPRDIDLRSGPGLLSRRQRSLQEICLRMHAIRSVFIGH